MKKIISLLTTLFLLTACGSKEATFDYSSVFDENGFFKNITASDYVEDYDYENIDIPDTALQVSEENVRKSLETLFTYFPPETKEITNRKIVDGDTVNIDYVGSVDGVEFEGGSTGGKGTAVTIGVTSYIDDFLQQLIGHTPGSTIDIHVTFPQNYQEQSLQGKDAVFVTTLNFIQERVVDDAYVTKNLKSIYGWTTVQEMNAGIKAEIVETLKQDYLYGFITKNIKVESIPEALIKYQEDSMIKFYEEYALEYEVTLEEFIKTYLNHDSVEALIESQKDYNYENAKFSMIMIAVAEKEAFNLTDAMLNAYFLEQTGSEDYSSVESVYGKPYLKHIIMNEMIFDLISSKN